ncbi:MAG TPA: rhomboid family intramembrane serine protease, partial [Gemmata sp.]|nr:rhomboid family intramembrane serine protease [Gemmata sp.]
IASRNPITSPLVVHGSLQPDAVLAGEVWRLVTPLFLHAGIWPLFVNMLALYWAGGRMEERYGSREFLAFYLLAGVFANIVCLLASIAGMATGAGVIGASGSVMAVMVLYACHYPRKQVLVNFILPMPVWVVVIVYLALDLLNSSWMAMGLPEPPIGLLSPFGGALIGAAYFLAQVRVTELFTRARRRSASGRVRPQLRVVENDPEDITPAPVGAAVENSPRPMEAQEPVDEHLEARLDKVLEKVSKYGQESLTPEEREILFRASELYKKRRK